MSEGNQIKKQMSHANEWLRYGTEDRCLHEKGKSAQRPYESAKVRKSRTREASLLL